MEKQYKLYILDKKYIEDTLSKLYEIFSKEQIIIINSNHIAVEYNYGTNDYKSILEKMSKFKATQNIITTSKFLKILNRCVEQNILIESIELFELLCEENEILNKYISKINYISETKEKYTKLLLSELEYLNYDEGIDIKSMCFKIRGDNKPLLINFRILNNGVILVDNEEILDKVMSIISII